MKRPRALQYHPCVGCCRRCECYGEVSQLGAVPGERRYNMNCSRPEFFTDSQYEQSFEVKLNGNPDTIIAKAKEVAQTSGMHFVGDDQTGHFRRPRH